MPYSTSWLIKDEVIFFYYYDPITQEEVAQSFQTINTMVESSPRSLVHSICDLGDLTKPLPLSVLASIARDYTPHPRIGWSLNTREQSKLMRFLSTVTQQILKFRNRSLTSFDEAVDHLKYVDSTLSWDKADFSVLPASMETKYRNSQPLAK